MQYTKTHSRQNPTAGKNYKGQNTATGKPCNRQNPRQAKPTTGKATANIIGIKLQRAEYCNRQKTHSRQKPTAGKNCKGQNTATGKDPQQGKNCNRQKKKPATGKKLQ
ncbi:hypothetical protein OS493_022116 [Desmophyllum pertusum]|uniref:Uncharacterized protein n=1 Tax=Desmophyllum pertusum TaxID=174260 RepID=A0A9X0CJW8_9CNID|nr:hypothetical protein OS493_022116 [Desmophyllum pertusum]